MNEATGRSATLPGPFAVDAHVHLHPVFELQAFLDAAAGNTHAAAQAMDSISTAVGVLLLAEGLNEGAFERLRSAPVSAIGPWTIHQTAERESLLARKDGVLQLIIIAGRQLVTSEGVEVLALLSAAPLSDGRPLADTIAASREASAVPVLPWGFGKWTMRRGALVGRLLHEGAPGVLLGDNGGRPARARTPPLLNEARRLGVPILPGSDPLPFPEQQCRAGSFGFFADTSLDESRPAEGLRAWLHTLRSQPRTYGDLETPGTFCWNQARMQWRKRVSRTG